ncbi:hypothetical protein DV515_00013626, partial [Chloebia gouldiae]
VVERAEGSLLKEVSNNQLYSLLKKLIFLLSIRQEPYFIMHIRPHSALPGFLAEGNAMAELPAMPIQNTLPNNQAKAIVQSCPDCQKLAIPTIATGVKPPGLNSLQLWQTDITQYQSFARFKHIHISIDTGKRNAHTLQKQFQLTPTEAHDIVESYDDCHAPAAPLPAGINPRGLRALELWQTVVTQIAKFGQLKYVHVTVDTFSSVMWASAHTGEKARDVIAHWRQAFAILGVPSAVKTDNGPAYASQKVRQFLQLW